MARTSAVGLRGGSTGEGIQVDAGYEAPSREQADERPRDDATRARGCHMLSVLPAAAGCI
jgi:hypothetical protein